MKNRVDVSHCGFLHVGWWPAVWPPWVRPSLASGLVSRAQGRRSLASPEVGPPAPATCGGTVAPVLRESQPAQGEHTPFNPKLQGQCAGWPLRAGLEAPRAGCRENGSPRSLAWGLGRAGLPPSPVGALGPAMWAECGETVAVACGGDRARGKQSRTRVGQSSTLPDHQGGQRGERRGWAQKLGVKQAMSKARGLPQGPGRLL